MTYDAFTAPALPHDPTANLPPARPYNPLTDAALARLSAATLIDLCHGATKASGWWTNLQTGEAIVAEGLIVPTKLLLIVSEITEAMEGHRAGKMDDKLPHRTMLEVELADAMIRIADLAGAMNLDLGGAIADKMAYNAQRADHKPANRAAAGGKAY